MAAVAFTQPTTTVKKTHTSRISKGHTTKKSRWWTWLYRSRWKVACLSLEHCFFSVGLPRRLAAEAAQQLDIWWNVGQLSMSFCAAQLFWRWVSHCHLKVIHHISGISEPKHQSPFNSERLAGSSRLLFGKQPDIEASMKVWVTADYEGRQGVAFHREFARSSPWPDTKSSRFWRRNGLERNWWFTFCFSKPLSIEALKMGSVLRALAGVAKVSFFGKG